MRKSIPAQNGLPALGLVGLLIGLTAGFAHASRPNVLLIICDDLNDSVEGLGGHPQARTPNMSRLVADGVRFTNAQCAAPLCGPSRASLLTGLSPVTTGYYGYNQGANKWRQNPSLKNARTFLEHFKANGYDVLGTGKIFHNGQEDWNVWNKGDGFGARPSFGPFPWDGKTDHPGAIPGINYMSSHPNLPEPLRSAVRWHSFGPLSDIPDWQPDSAKGIPGHKGWILYRKPFRYVSEEDRDLMPDELNAAWAADVLSRPHDRPFLLAVGFNRPHAPFYAPKKYFDMFPIGEVRLPPYLKDDLNDCARALWDFPDRPSPLGFLPGKFGFHAFTLLQETGGESMWKRWIQAYLACVTYVDDQLGKILDALAKSPHADNTIVIFTSDHGYHMGEKDYIFKNSLWEESSRVPLIVVAPGVSRSNTACEHPISLMDMFPTLIDLCGLSSAPNEGGNGLQLDGHSIRPFLVDPDAGQWDGPSVALTAIAGRDVLEINEPGKAARLHLSVRSERYRYILCNNGEEELYDHQNDPHEWRNLAGKPDHAAITNQLREQLERLAGL
jgi:arylsulfatase A-like enzyme